MTEDMIVVSLIMWIIALTITGYTALWVGGGVDG